jgi:hypothetical protein
MTTREDLHALIDRMPEHSLAAIERYLIAVEAGMPADIAEDDEPLSPGDEAMLAASRAERARGEPPVTHDELGAQAGRSSSSERDPNTWLEPLIGIAHSDGPGDLSTNKKQHLQQRLT